MIGSKNKCPAIVRPFERIPASLKERRQWVNWKYDYCDDTWTKRPLIPGTNGYARTNDPSTWGDFPSAQAGCESDIVDGVGFVFIRDDPFVGIDLDNCVGEGGKVDARAKAIVNGVNSYAEISPGRKGIKIILCGQKPGQKCKRTDYAWGNGQQGAIEIYDKSRFFTITGRHLPNTSTKIEERNAELCSLYAEIFGEKDAPQRHDQIVPVRPAPADDGEIIAKALASKIGAKFRNLWDNGDVTGHGGDHSGADLALCDYLAFYCGPDGNRIDRLFRRSALCRPKWDERHSSAGRTYGQMTIEKALEGRTDYFHWTPKPDSIGGVSCPPRQPEATGHPTRFAPQNDQLLCTDLGNAQRLARSFGSNIRHCAQFGKSYYWNDQIWMDDQRGYVMRCAFTTAKKIFQEAAQAIFSEQVKALAAWGIASQHRSRLEAMVKLVFSFDQVAITPGQLDAYPYLLNVSNGTLDLRSGKLRPHSRDDLMTMMAPVRYDENAPCPLFDSFLERIMDGEAELIQYVQRLIGMSLTGDVREQILPIFYGQGQNGKSTLLDTITGVMGDYAANAPDSLMTVQRHQEHPTEIADLFGRRLVVASETEAGRQLRIQLVKKMTGDARLKGRFMRQDYFEFDRTHTTILVTNNKPVIRESKIAIWRRIHLVPFAVEIPLEQQDKTLMQKLRAEWPGVLAWAVRGCLDWQQHGLCPPKAVSEATQEYRQEQDRFSAFFEENCILDPRGKVSRASIQSTYRQWSDSGKERWPLDVLTLYDRLREIDGVRENYVTEGGRSVRGFGGLRLINPQNGDQHV